MGESLGWFTSRPAHARKYDVLDFRALAEALKNLAPCASVNIKQGAMIGTVLMGADYQKGTSRPCHISSYIAKTDRKLFIRKITLVQHIRHSNEIEPIFECLIILCNIIFLDDDICMFTKPWRNKLNLLYRF